MRDHDFGTFIRELRGRRGLSQFQLGTLIGVTDKAVSKWESGRARPALDTCVKLAAALNLTLDELLDCRFHVSAKPEKGNFAMKEEFWREARQALVDIYGEHPPVEVLSRYESEREAIRGSDYIVCLEFLRRLRRTFHEAQTDFTWRGLQQSSLVAWLMGTETISPLEPHYYCPKCKRVEFHSEVYMGLDLPEKVCDCGAHMRREGIRVTSALTSLQAKKNIVIDLNISYEMLEIASRELLSFFKGCRFLLVNYFNQKNGIAGKRYIIDKAPEPGKEDAIQECGWEEGAELCREYSYPSICFLCNREDTALQHLCVQTNRHVEQIDFADKAVLDAFCECRLLERMEETLPNYPSLPALLRRVRPEKFSDLYRLVSLSHMAGEWEADADAALSAAPGGFAEMDIFREDVYDRIEGRLRECGVRDDGFALRVMEDVRKGQYARSGVDAATERAFRDLDIPDEYVNYLKKIRYMMPRHHVLSIFLMQLRMVWFQLYEPERYARAMKREYVR